MSYYDPVTFGILFESGSDESEHPQARSPRGLAWFSTMISSLRRRNDGGDGTTECRHSQSR
jgi:hypothetical protein